MTEVTAANVSAVNAAIAELGADAVDSVAKLQAIRIGGNDAGVPSAITEVLSGAAGDDTILGLDGTDFVTGLAGDDALIGGEGNDQLFGNTGNDRLLGGDGSDALSGNEGDDVLFGGAGDDQIAGGVGNPRRHHIGGGAGINCKKMRALTPSPTSRVTAFNFRPMSMKTS